MCCPAFQIVLFRHGYLPILVRAGLVPLLKVDFGVGSLGGAPRAVSSFGRAARQSTSVLICFGLALAPSFLRAIRSIPSFGITKFAVNICSPDTNKNTNKSDGWDRREQTVTNTDVRGRAHFQRFPSTARTDADALEQA